MATSLTLSEFFGEVVSAVRGLVSTDLQGFQHRSQGGLVKLFFETPSEHYEVWRHRANARLEIGLHFEWPDARRNRRRLDVFRREELLLKAAVSALSPPIALSPSGRVPRPLAPDPRPWYKAARFAHLRDGGGRCCLPPWQRRVCLTLPRTAAPS